MRLSRVKGRLRQGNVSRETSASLADAELAEDPVEHLLDIDPPGDPPERPGSPGRRSSARSSGSRRVLARGRAQARHSSSAWRWRSRVRAGASVDADMRFVTSASRARSSGPVPQPVTAETGRAGRPATSGESGIAAFRSTLFDQDQAVLVDKRRLRLGVDRRPGRPVDDDQLQIGMLGAGRARRTPSASISSATVPQARRVGEDDREARRDRDGPR